MDVKTGGARGVLNLSGFPNPAEWQRGILEEVWPLDAEWSLKLGPIDTEAPRNTRYTRWGLEHLFRALDRFLYGRSLRRAGDLNIMARLDEATNEPGSLHLAYCAQAATQEAAKRNEPVLYVEYEGMKMSDLEEAVRRRLGLPGAMLNAQVWMVDPSRQKRLLFEGQLDMDHRSLCKSIALCAAKLPALLRGALARIDQPGYGVAAPARAVAPVPAHRLLARLMRAVGRRLLWREQWQIETYHGTPNGDATGKLSSLIMPPPTAFWADPFLVSMKDRVWLLFEELPYLTDKGHISAIELDQDGKPKSAPQMVLSEPWHLAYPFVYETGGKTYMIPDASKSRELILYECGDDPLSWKRRVTLMSGLSLADATIAEHDGKLWMFATHGDDCASLDDTLHIYWAEQIDGPWHPHKLNPVKIDASSSRPAGSMWTADGYLHRVVQNCSTVYGGSTKCTRVRVLNENEFEEEVLPDWGGGDVKPMTPWHTFNRHANMFVLDRLRRTLRWGSR